MLLAFILFVLTYVCMILCPRIRCWVALAGAAVFIFLQITGILPMADGSSYSLLTAAGAVNWNVLMMLTGTMITVALFIESKMPNRLADWLLTKCASVRLVVVVMSLFAGVVSAFVDNVATVLMIAPVGLAIAKKLDISPVPMLICISVSSNLQGAATLVGDTTSILLAGQAGMDFTDFFWMEGRPGIFWAVELGAVATVPVILFLFRKARGRVEAHDLTPVTDYFPTWLLLSNIILLILASFLPDKPELTNGLLCIGVALVGLLRAVLQSRSLHSLKQAVSQVDYMTLLLLAGLFVVIDGIENAGVIAMIAQWFLRLGGGDLFRMYTLIVWGSVVFSAFVDNIPYVATMLPVISGISSMMGCSPYVLYFGLLVGATLGGNLTPIGASANIAAIGILQKEGYQASGKDFMRIGVPFTLTAVLVGYLYCWIVWAGVGMG